MYARNVSISLKDEITFLGEDGKDVVATKLWDRKASADAYGRETYPRC